MRRPGRRACPHDRRADPARTPCDVDPRTARLDRRPARPTTRDPHAPPWRRAGRAALLLRISTDSAVERANEEDLDDLLTDLRLLGLAPTLLGIQVGASGAGHPSRTRVMEQRPGRPEPERGGPQARAAGGAAAAPAGVRRTFNEAAHKLGHWPMAPAWRRRRTARPSTSLSRAGASTTSATSSLTPARSCWRSARSGVVYGDLGTSPLYTEQVIFSQHADAAQRDRGRRLRDRLADLLGADDDRLDQVRRLPDAGPQSRRRRRDGTRRADPAPSVGRTTRCW